MAADLSTRIEALAESTLSLRRSVTTLTDADARAPSLLPGWSRGHVLAHVAGNAEAMVNLATWARTGKKTPMYAGRAERDAAIRTQSSLPVADLVAAVDASAERLMVALGNLGESDWDAPIRYGAQDLEGIGADIPVLRRTEVEVHHVDLGLDYTLAHWPEDFVENLLADVCTELSSRTDPLDVVLVGNDDEGRWVVGDGTQEISGPPPALLGWLIGRTDGIALHSDAPLPTVGVWK